VFEMPREAVLEISYLDSLHVAIIATSEALHKRVPEARSLQDARRAPQPGRVRPRESCVAPPTRPTLYFQAV
jgi:hypothetical protein